ncbi:hypothetical protein BOW53_15300 [Solemya pervernicosa gill symbiont]|uniref:HNH nuclease domain-containing protein n=1 Tax=Solemya pervernicosa gill symbiont TaxID=642797 RepID=A0A1T2L0D4_9GAMM|nr:hypothetical protein BOW53_15300 [Solemya pervernicosa gill symbiont]
MPLAWAWMPKTSFRKNSDSPKKGMSLKELKDIALKSVVGSATKDQKIANIKNRSKAIKLYAKKRANGICEACGKSAPFKTKDGPYLEVHHMFKLADGGPDIPVNVIALCPVCHCRAHYALDSTKFNDSLIDIVKTIEDAII